MKRSMLIVVAPLLVAMGTSTPAFGAPADNEVILYEHNDLVGRSATYRLEPGLPYAVVEIGPPLAGQVSSVAVGTGVQLVPFRGHRLFNDDGDGDFYARSYVKDESCQALHYSAQPDRPGCVPIASIVSTMTSVGPVIPNDTMRSFIMMPRGTPLRLVPGVELINRRYKAFLKRSDEILGETIFIPARYPASGGECLDEPWAPYLAEIDGLRLADHTMAVVYMGANCTGDSRSFPLDRSSRRHFDLDALGMDGARSLQVVYQGPPLAGYAPPAPPSVKARAPAVPSVAQAPASPKATGPVAVARPTAPVPGLGPSATLDAIKTVRLLRRGGAALDLEIAYRVSGAHGPTVYVGVWPYASGRAVGGYRPAALPGAGDGTVQIRSTLNDPQMGYDEVEVFLFEPGKPPFVSGRFRREAIERQ